MNNNNNIQELYIKFLNDTATAEETAYLLKYFEQSDVDALHNLIRQALEEDEKLTDISYLQKHTDRLYKQIKLRINESDVKSAPIWRINQLVPYAAAILIFFSIGIALYFYNNKNDKTEHSQLSSIYGDDVLPGGNNAYITLSDGRKIELDSSQSALMVADGKLLYENGKEILPETITEYTSIHTPIGGQYQMILPDGTKAWLNAASSLTYPIRFNQKERTIEINGEVYLEVASDKQKPFIVTSGNQRIEVLGTAFNVRNYSERIITTLLHGKIALANTSNNQRIFLNPGDQATLTSNNIQTIKVNPSEFIVWKDGIILTKEATLKEICAELERWYGVNFVFPAGYKNNEIALNSINRTEMLSSVLAALKNSYRVDFEIKGKEVFVR